MSRYPWRDTSTDIAGGQPPQWETPQGAQKKADDALTEAKDYTDEQNAGFTEHIQDTTIHVTPADKANWNSKAPGVHTHANATPTVPGFMSAEDKTKLNGVEAEANKYVHPATHPPAIIAQDTGNRFVSDAEKASWSGKAETTEATTAAKGLMSPTDKQKLNGIQAAAEVNQNAFSGVNGVVATSKSDTLQLTGGTGITITEDAATKRLTVTATGDATPGAHASSHITGGTDVIPDAVIGGSSGLMSGSDAKFVRQDGESKTGAQAKADAAKQAANEYTDQKVGEIVIDDASLTEKGIVQLSNSTGSDSEVEAATPKAVNTVRQLAVSQIGDLAELQTTDKDNLVNALNEVFTHVDEGKDLVKTAVIVKGGTVAGTSPHSFQQLADGIESIETATVINGQQQVARTYAETIAANDPVYTDALFTNDITISDKPNGQARIMSLHPDGDFLFVATSGSISSRFYSISGKVLTPVTVTGFANSATSFIRAQWSPDGRYLFIASTSSSWPLYIFRFDKSTLTFTQLPNLPTADRPVGGANDISLSKDGVYLVVGNSGAGGAQTLNWYKFNDGTITKLALTTMPGGGVTYSVAWSPDDVYLAVSVDSSVAQTLVFYKRSGDTLTKLPDLFVPHAGAARSMAFSPDGSHLCTANNGPSTLAIYKRTGDVFYKLASDAIRPVGRDAGVTVAGNVYYHPSGEYLAVGMNSGSPLSFYKRRNDVYIEQKGIGTSSGLGTATWSGTWSKDGDVLFLGGVLTQLGFSVQRDVVRKFSNSMLDIVNTYSEIGYALESGQVGDIKEIVTIWR